MDCINLQALGDSSDSQQTSSFTESTSSNIYSKTDELSNIDKLQSCEESNNDFNGGKVDIGTQKENLYNKYKDGLKLIYAKKFDEAESVFLELLDSSLMKRYAEKEIDDAENDDLTQELLKLRYLFFKNLAELNYKHKCDYTNGLNYLIEAIKIDSSDLGIWQDIGENALKLNKFLIARYAFEECLKINSTFWPSIDNLIVLLYGLGNYSLCLKYVFHALKLDKFFINAIILMKKIQLFNEIYYSRQIEIFINNNYVQMEIDLDCFLKQIPGCVYDGLMKRIDLIKLKYREQFIKINDEESTKNSTNYSVEISNKISTWATLGNFIIKLNEMNKFNITIPLKITQEPENIVEAADDEKNKMDVNEADQTLTNELKNDGTPKVTDSNISNSNSKSLKRKKKDPVVEELWKESLKRRSSRKGGDKVGCDEILISEILRKYFDENFLSDVQTIKTPTKKSKSVENNILKSVSSLKDNESMLVIPSNNNEISIFDLLFNYLKNLSLNYDHQWSAGLDEIYLNIFQILNKQYNLFDAFTSEENPEEFMYLCSIILVYLEIEFSKFKEFQLAEQKKNKAKEVFVIEKEVKINNKYIHILVYQLQQLEYFFERFQYKLNQSQEIQDAIENKRLLKSSNYFLIRMFCLNLFTCLSCHDEAVSPDYYTNKIISELDSLNSINIDPILIPNSKIFNHVSKDSVKEFLKINKKNKIFKSNDEINRMYEEKNYSNIISQLEEFAETHKLSFTDTNFKPQIFIQLLSSYFNLNQMEKCGYFCRKFLREIISYLQEQNNMNDVIVIADTNQNSKTTLKANHLGDQVINNLNSEQTKDLCDFLYNVLEMIHKVQPLLTSSPASNANSNSNSNASSSMLNDDTNTESSTSSIKLVIIHETIWLMYQLIAIFFENNDMAVKFELQFKPLKAFMIIFDCMLMMNKTCTKSDRVEYISLVHDYLAKNGFCSIDNSEFLFWSIDIITSYITNCEICNEFKEEGNEKEEDDVIMDEEPIQNENSQNNQASEMTIESLTNKVTKSVKNSQKQIKTNEMESCGICDECNEILEQFFSCLFGYKKKSARYLKNHSVKTVQITLDNCLSLYKFYKPKKLPEYDDLSKTSIPIEFNELLGEIVKLILIETNKDDTSFDIIRERFVDFFSNENYNELANVDLQEFFHERNEKEEKFNDIYYLIADYYLKKDRDVKNIFALKYYIKDLTINNQRFDSWISLALAQSSVVLDEYLEDGLNICDESQLDKFLKSVNFSINLFRKSLEYIRPDDHKVLIEFGSFLYQIHSYCSRQLKIDQLISNFQKNSSIRTTLERKKKEFLQLTFEIYTKANNDSSIVPLSKEKVETNSEMTNEMEIVVIDSTSSMGSSSTSNLDPSLKQTQSQKLSKNLEKENNPTHSKNSQKSNEKQEELEENAEEWLYHYMFGKIKEKLNDQYDLLQCLEHYKHSYEFLDRNQAEYLKRITYKTKSNYSVESNEIFYRIYALTLKRLEFIGFKKDNDNEIKSLLTFLRTVIEARFVKTHNDMHLKEMSTFLEENVFRHSKMFLNFPHKSINEFKQCICICIAGLCQILRRFSQHYRSLYRLAYFYSKFLDFNYFEFSKNLLLSTPNWSSLPYMPCHGLFQEKNKTNFFNGIWRISNNSNKDQDLERSGSFAHHLFETIRLLIEVFDKTDDYGNLTELSKAFYQKPDQDKEYLHDTHREFFASYCISLSYKILDRIAFAKFRQEFNDLADFNAYQTDLIPLLLDSHEVYKISSKYCQTILKNVENLLLKLYIQFHPEAIIKVDKINMDEILKYCQLVEKKDKSSKAKARANKNANSAQNCNTSMSIVIN